MVGINGQPLHAFVGNVIICFTMEQKLRQINPKKQAILVI